MQPKRSCGTIPILFLLFIFIFLVSILILLFFSSSSLHFQSSNPHQTLVNPHHPSSFSLTVKVLSFDRLPSLRRCLLSLSSAHYPPSSSHPIHLHIFLDHLPNSTSSLSLAPSHSILDFVDSFHWPHGDKLVHYRTANAGLQAQWLEAWWPSSDDDFAFVVEDDLEVSPYFYDFLERVILKYYYDQDNYSPDVFGASLQRPRFVAGKHGNKLQVDDETRLFLYQMVGTWGQLLFPKPWKEFRLWYDIHKAKGVRPILQGMVTTGWYKKMGERIWTPWFIKFIHHRGYYNIYTNFLHERALSVSHRDAGVNYGKTAGPDSKLIDESSIDYKLWDFQPLKNLKWYDFCFSQVLPWRVVKSYNELGSVLGTLQRQRTVLLVSLYKTTEKTARNLICQFDMLGIKNFIFVGGKTELLHDLSRRGYPVVDSDIFFDSIKSSYKLTGEKSETDLKKEFLVKGNIIKKSLELGYHCWMMDGNIFPHTNFFTELPDSSYTYAAVKNLDLLFVKSSPASLKFWIVFVSKMVASKSLPSDQNFFVYFAAKELDEMGSEKVWWFDDLKFGAEIGMDNTGQELMKDDKKYVFWSSEASQDSVQRDLEKMDMWLIDGDSSCTAVVCNK